MPGKVERRVRDLLPVEWRFKVQIDALPASCNGVRQRGLPDLTRAEQRHRGKMAKAVLNQSLDAPRYHPMQLWHIIPDLHAKLTRLLSGYSCVAPVLCTSCRGRRCTPDRRRTGAL